jgi:hypothetical protein
MKERFPEGWNPPRKVGRSDMELMRRLHNIDNATWSTPNLAERFRISPEAVRRILRSKFQTDAEKEELRTADMLEKELAEYDAREAQADQAAPTLEYTAKPQKEPPRSATPLRAGFRVERSSKSYKWAVRE